MNNFIALIITFASALAWLRLMDFFAHRGWISSPLSRKIIHMGTGPIYVLCWLFFDEALISRFLAALVPLSITLQFALVGLGIMRDEASVKAMSRTGDRREILRGPLYYGIVFVLLTVIFWLETPVGIVALMLLCGGDGLADILGRRFGQFKLPWNPTKSWVGSLGMLAGSWVFAVVVMAIFTQAGVFSLPISSYIPAITLIALIGTLVETLPIKDLDNITVTLAAVLAGLVLF
ncbi:MAG: phosphatidate cytidylyltransferase [Anaerolineales bacterium]|nr:phosphatidate cytidylyltransferase [Anaerolineales bacterium]